MSSSSVIGTVPSDLAANNIEFTKTITQCGGTIRSKVVNACLINSINAVVDNLVINESVTLPPPSYLGMVFNPSGVTSGDLLLSSVSGHTKGSNFDLSLGTQIPLTLQSSNGTNIVPSGNGAMVLMDNTYVIHYDLIIRAFNTGVAQPLGVTGRANINGDTAVTIYTAIVVNNNFSLQNTYSHDSMNFQLVEHLVRGSHATLALQAGDVVYLYVYGLNNFVGATIDYTIASAHLNISSIQ